MTYKVVLKSVDEALVCDFLNEGIEQYFHIILLFLNILRIKDFKLWHPWECQS